MKWTWDRKFGIGAKGAFYVSTLGLENKDSVKVEGKYTVSINLDNPNPLLAKLQPNLFMPIYDLTKCKAVPTADDPWARKFLENNSAGLVLIASISSNVASKRYSRRGPTITSASPRWRR